MNRIDKVAIRVIRKWIRKGNMARAMRDILPHSGLSFEERDEVAKIVHNVVRYKRYLEYVMDEKGMKRSPENYIYILKSKPRVDASRDIIYSLSPELDSLTPEEFIPIINREPDTVLCINLNKISRDKAIKELVKEGFTAKPFIPETAVVTESAGRYSSLIKGGLAIVQDASSQIISKIAGGLGEDILDYCAGSGGKSLAMYSFYKNRKFFAYDINRKKLESLKKRAISWGMNVEILDDEPDGLYSVVLVDAPCSGVGAAARNPEFKYQTNFADFSETQLNILRKASEHVLDGGYLVYVVCSYTPYETEDVIEKFIMDSGSFVSVDLNTSHEEYVMRKKYGSYLMAGDILYISILKRT